MNATALSPSIQASAPGSLMLLGEHSVLRGKHAIVMAINKRLRVTLTALCEKIIRLDSNLGHIELTLANLGHIKTTAPLEFALETLKAYPPDEGVHIHIQSDMSATMGFGTSASLVISLLGALMALKNDHDKDHLYKRALKIIHTIQGRGSGADLAASLWGGIGLFRTDPLSYKQLSQPADLFVKYCGYKTKTADVMRIVHERFKDYPTLLESLDHTIDTLTMTAAEAINKPTLLGRFLNEGAGLMESLGVHTRELSQFLWELRDQCHGVKLSGSGLGDCAIGVMKDNYCPDGAMVVEVAPKGLVVERL